MIIAVSALGKEKDDLVDTRFGRCNFFQIYNTETGEFKPLENKGIAADEGAGIAASNQIVDEDVQVLITGKVGPNAYKIMEQSSIRIYSCTAVKVSEALDFYTAGELKEIVTAGAAHSGLNS